MERRTSEPAHFRAEYQRTVTIPAMSFPAVMAHRLLIGHEIPFPDSRWIGTPPAAHDLAMHRTVPPERQPHLWWKTLTKGMLGTAWLLRARAHMSAGDIVDERSLVLGLRARPSPGTGKVDSLSAPCLMNSKNGAGTSKVPRMAHGKREEHAIAFHHERFS